MYTTILHPLRKAYNLSIDEYCVLDSIHLLSNNQKYGGWCIASKHHLAETLDISERKVFQIINTLEAKGLIERNEQGSLRTLDEWNEKVANKGDYYVAFNGKESSFVTGKPLKHKPNPLDSAKSADTLQNLQGGMQNLQGDSAKSADYNNKENNNKNNNTYVDKSTSEFEKFISFYEKESNKKVRSLKPRLAKFKARRKTFSYEEIEQAAQRILGDAFLQGDNDSSKVYGDIDYILRNDQIIEKHLQSNPTKWNPPTNSVRSVFDIEI